MRGTGSDRGASPAGGRHRPPATGHRPHRAPGLRPPASGLRPILVAFLLLLLVPALATAKAKSTILVVGDSLSAGYGLETGQGWVTLLEKRIAATHPDYAVVNASISGDTSAGGVSRLPEELARNHPAVVIIELGGNDGLRGLSVDVTRANLDRMITLSQHAGAKVLLLGMRMPPNYGPRYTKMFHAIYLDLAKKRGVALVPFLLEGVGGHPDLMQADGMHPRAVAQQRLLDNVWPRLVPLL